jgi:hypothetical protein
MPKTADPKAGAVLDDLAQVAAAIRQADAERRKLVARRRALVKRARRYGVTFDALAGVLGVSRARVQQLEAGD